MSLENIIAYPIKGVNPQDRLPITAKLWSDSHDHHVKHRHVHALSAHRPGIVYGLDVMVSGTDEQTVTVTPGVAIDGSGNTIILSTPESFTFKERGANFLVIEHLVGDDGDTVVELNPQEHLFPNFIEYRRIVVTKESPRDNQIELARVQRSDARSPIRPALNDLDPGQNELSLLYRTLAFPHCYVDASIAEVSYVPQQDMSAWKPNRGGLTNLIHESRTLGFHLSFAGAYDLSEPDRSREPLLLYMAGTQGFKDLTQEEIVTLKSLLKDGAFLLGESVGGNPEFVRSFQALARALGADLKPLSSGDRLLTSHHLFADVPQGAYGKGEISMDPAAGVVLSTCDFGGAWQGRIEGKGASRDRIRDSLDFGRNLLVYAARRKRAIGLERLR